MTATRRLATTALLAASVTLITLAGCKSPPPGPGKQASQPTTKGVAAKLYFPGVDDRLHGESHPLPENLDAPEDRVLALAQAWIAGPTSDSLVRPLPSVDSLHVDLTATGLLYVDLLTAADAPRPQAGSTVELTAIYSLVDTFALNVPEVKSVILLWNGTQPPTLTGHIDTGVPLVADTSLIANDVPTQ